MESTPVPNKRTRDEVFTSPELDCDIKRQCNLSTNTDSPQSEKLVDTSSDVSSLDTSNMNTSEVENLDVNNPSPFIGQLLVALSNKDILAAIGTAVAEAIKPALREEMSTIIERNRQIESEIVILKDKVTDQNKTIEMLSDKLDRCEQYSRRNNVRIMGIPEKAGENTDELVREVAKSIGVDLSPADIDISHRVPKYPPTPQSSARSIIVMFVSNASKRSLLSNRYKLKTIRQDNSPRIFVNEDLTKARAILARKARTLVSEKKADSTWVTGGVVLIKLRDGSLKKVANNSQMEEVYDATKLTMVINLSQ